MPVSYEWRGSFHNQRLNQLHAEAFETRVYSDSEWNWQQLVQQHSFGWVIARDGGNVVGFLNVLWDGLAHAWLQDVMVSKGSRRHGIAEGMVSLARIRSRDAGCEWLHVDFDDEHRSFYLERCGFTSTNAGLIALQSDDSSQAQIHRPQ